MEDKERLIKALNSLAETGEKRIAQQEAERKKEAERARRRKELYAQFYKSSAPITLYVPEDSALLDANESNPSNPPK